MSDSLTQQAAAAMKENRVPEAIALLQQAHAATPDDFNTNYMLGVALGKAGRRPESISRLLKATHLNPKHTAALTQLGLAYAAAEKTEPARSAFQAALKIDPNFAAAQNALTKLPAKVNTPAKPMIAPAKAAPPPAPVKNVATPAKPAKPAPPKEEIDYAEWTLRILGITLLLGGIYLRFFMTYESYRIYKGPGLIAIIIGIALIKAGFPSEDDWKDDYR